MQCSVARVLDFIMFDHDRIANVHRNNNDR